MISAKIGTTTENTRCKRVFLKVPHSCTPVPDKASDWSHSSGFNAISSLSFKRLYVLCTTTHAKDSEAEDIEFDQVLNLALLFQVTSHEVTSFQ